MVPLRQKIISFNMYLRELMVTGVQASAGQQMEAGDVIFTVDVQKVQEKIKALESELDRADQKDRLSISRAEASYQDVKTNAEEEKALAYEAYTKAVSEYQNYINTHKKSTDTKTADSDENTGDTQTSESADSVYDASVAAELENAIEAQKSAYEAVVREQEKQVRAASDTVQQTKEDLNLSNDTDTLEEQLNAFAYLCRKWRRVSRRNVPVSLVRSMWQQEARP